MPAKKWNKEETFALIQQYDRFPKLGNITLPEYRNKEIKRVKLKNCQRGISDKGITRKWNTLRSQMYAEKKKKSESRIDEVCLKMNLKFYDAHFMVLP